MEPKWIRLIEKLHQSGHESAYLDRLKARLPGRASVVARREASLREVEAEIAQEMASALGRAAEKVDLALLKLELLGREIDDLEAASSNAEPNDQHDSEPSDEPSAARDVEAKVRAFDIQRQAAIKALWELRVHREALGINLNQHLAELYPIPKARG